MKKITELVAAVGGAVASFFVTMPPIVWVLIAVMTIDYITGLTCGALGKSKKTENGYLASHEAFRGLLKKALILLVVLLAALLDYAAEIGAEKVVTRNRQGILLNTAAIDCDYYEFLAGNVAVINSFTGQYMSAYSWAEFTTGYLERQAMK